MLDKILRRICNEMSDVLNHEQIEKLKNVIYINFRGKVVSEDINEIAISEMDSDANLIKMFVASKKISGRQNSTIRQYVNELRFCRNAIGKSFIDITTMDLRFYLGMMKERRSNKMSTIQNKVHYLNSFFTFLFNEELIDHNPMSKIETPSTEKVIRKAFSAEEMESMRKGCAHIRDRALIEFMFSTGLRVSELTSLNVGDIDMSKKEFVVVGKGSKERTVYFSDVAKFYLKQYLDWRLGHEGISAEILKEMPLFATIRSPFLRIHKSGVEMMCRKLGEKCRISNVHPHRFRRTFATNMANRGMKMEELMKLMGHSKIDTTLIYCNVNEDNIRHSYSKFCA